MKTVRLGDICDLMTGGTPSRTHKEYFQDGKIKWLVSGDIHKGEILDCDGRITEAGLNNSNARILPMNSVMIALNGQGKTRATVAMLRTEAACNQSLVSIYPKDDKQVLPEYIFWNLKGRYDELRRLTGDGGNDRRGLNMIIIRSIKIPYPPTIEEQRHVVERLGVAFKKIDRTVELTEKNISNTKILLENSLSSLYEDEGSTIRKLESAVEKFLTGPFGSMLHISDYVSGGVPLVNPQNIINGKIVASEKTLVSSKKVDELSRYRLKAGDIIIARRGEMGRCAYVEPEQEGWLCGTGCFVLRLNRGSDPRYLSEIIQLKSTREKLEEKAVGTTMKNLNQSILLSLRLSLPGHDEQERIYGIGASLKQSIIKAMDLYSIKLGLLDDLKQSMLRQAFTESDVK